MKGLYETHYVFPGQTNFYRGKVRDVYTIADNRLVVIASDRISAFDVVMPLPVPYKGQVLNQIAFHFLKATEDILPNWTITQPDPNATIGHLCVPYRVEMVVRGYLAGHAWRTYKAGHRVLCGVSLPEGLKENDKLPNPIITPTTKAIEGHDEDIDRASILARNIVSESDYIQLEKYALQLFERGTAMAAAQGLLLVDTKYEFGKKDGVIYLIDEIHTPDSSRYFYSEGYAARQEAGIKQKQLSKEFVREWLIENDFMGKEGQLIPIMDEPFIASITDRYIELYETITGKPFIKTSYDGITDRIEKAVIAAL